MGNKLGWILAGMLVLFVAIVMIVTMAPSSRSRATSDTLALGVLDIHEPSVSVVRAIGALPFGPGNAADDFIEACNVWKQNESTLKEVCGGNMRKAGYVPAAEAIDALTQIDVLVARAAGKSRMQFVFSGNTTRELEVEMRYKPAATLEYVGDALSTLATYHMRAGNFDRAAETLKHLVVLGWHMMRERALLYMVLQGLDTQVAALNGLEDVYNAGGESYASRLVGLREYRENILDVRSAMRRKIAVIWPPSNRAKPGDIFNIVEKDADRCCRVQGVLALAFLRFTTANRADRNYTNELIARCVKSDDPLIAAAARAARDWEPAAQ